VGRPTLDYRSPATRLQPRFSRLAGLAFALAALSCPLFPVLLSQDLGMAPRTRDRVMPLLLPSLVLIALTAAVGAEWRIRKSRGALTGSVATRMAIGLCAVWLTFIGLVALFVWRMSSFG
jgi:hypothetical protein